MSREKPEAIFEKYLDVPDKLNGEQLRLALDFQDKSPVEALIIRQRREAERRELHGGGFHLSLAADSHHRAGAPSCNRSRP
jgi:hypothetical protein